jgi:S-adenosylmethionine-diacylglycerol 3-amino-3-carboxypropyl transferase
MTSTTMPRTDLDHVDAIAATAPAVAGDALRYSTVWEDVRVLRQALAIAPGDRVLSIAAAGDNAIALLLDDPGEVVAVDLSPTQLALCELKVAALRHLDHATRCRFLGYDQRGDDVGARAFRLATWARLRRDVDVATRAVWDARADDIAGGVVHRGRLERWFRRFSHGVLPLVQRRSTLRALRQAPDLEAQRAVFHERFDHAGWRLLCRVFFSRALMRRGRDPAFLRHVDDADVGETMRRRATRALTDQHLADALLPAWLLDGGPTMATLPLWARPEHEATLRARLDRLRFVQGDLRQVAAREGRCAPFSAMNLSDVFEYMSVDDARATWQTLAAASTTHARLAWWELLLRRRPVEGDALVVDDALRSLAETLHAQDGGFFYGGFVVATPRPA